MSSTSPKSDRGPLLGALLRVVAQASSERHARWLATSGFDDIQPAHSAAIQPLWDAPEGARITTLARAARITKQSMSALIDHLERNHYVERVDDPDDARATRIRLTARGRAYARAVRAFARSLEADWAELIGTQRLEELRTTLELLRSKLHAGED